jgi:dolichol-phosphate mannosyltransferase
VQREITDKAESRPGLVSVVVPTRNEALNVAPLVARVAGALGPRHPRWELVFVDDSDDATPQAVLAAARDGYPVRLLHRAPEVRWGGLGGAVSDGFRVAQGEVIAVMDADLQHPPEVLPALFARAQSSQVDLVVGDRFRWPGAAAGLAGPWRHFVARGGRHLVHLLVPPSRALHDPLSGLFAFRAELLDGVDLRPSGYKVLLEVAVQARPQAVTNVGFDFAPRRAGRSKASWREGVVFLRHLGRLVRATRSRPRPELRRPTTIPA